MSAKKQGQVTINIMGDLPFGGGETRPLPVEEPTIPKWAQRHFANGLWRHTFSKADLDEVVREGFVTEADCLEYEAWTDADAMGVLVDKLLEEGRIVERPAHALTVLDTPKFKSTPRDNALYQLEAEARQWLLRGLPNHLVLGVGEWPDFRFIVIRKFAFGELFVDPANGNDEGEGDRESPLRTMDEVTRRMESGVRVEFCGAPIEGVERLLRDPEMVGRHHH